MTSVASGVQLAITPLTGTTGAEIRGVNLRERLEPADVDPIRQVLVDYKAIFFAGQHLTTEQHPPLPPNAGKSPRRIRSHGATMATPGFMRSITARFGGPTRAATMRCESHGVMGGTPM